MSRSTLASKASREKRGEVRHDLRARRGGFLERLGPNVQRHSGAPTFPCLLAGRPTWPQSGIGKEDLGRGGGSVHKCRHFGVCLAAPLYSKAWKGVILALSDARFEGSLTLCGWGDGRLWDVRRQLPPVLN